jgi:hypothetical protein
MHYPGIVLHCNFINMKKLLTLFVALILFFEASAVLASNRCASLFQDISSLHPNLQAAERLNNNTLISDMQFSSIVNGVDLNTLRSLLYQISARAGKPLEQTVTHFMQASRNLEKELINWAKSKSNPELGTSLSAAAKLLRSYLEFAPPHIKNTIGDLNNPGHNPANKSLC